MGDFDGLLFIVLLLVFGLPALSAIGRVASKVFKGDVPTQKQPLSGDLSDTPKAPPVSAARPVMPTLEELIQHLSGKLAMGNAPVHSLPPHHPPPVQPMAAPPHPVEGQTLETPWGVPQADAVHKPAAVATSNKVAPHKAITHDLRQMVIAETILSRRTGPHKPWRK